MNTPNQAEYCDHCGEPCQALDLVCYEAVPWNTASANKGESAVLCLGCVSDFKSEDRAKQEKGA